MEILVIHVSRIGDTLLATPALRAIAETHPEARITVLAHPNRAEVLQHLPFLARVGSITKNSAPWRGWLGWLGGKPYDLALVFGHDKALVTYALRVAWRVAAFRQHDPALDGRLQPAVEEPPRHQRHAVDALLALPAALGMATKNRRLAYRVTDEEATWARSVLTSLAPDHPGPLIGLQIASFPTKAWRDWPPENFLALCQRILAAHPGAHFLIFGGSEESARTEALHRQLAGHASLFAGRLTLRQTAALMSRLDLYVGVDTGPTHLMGCFDIPLVALYHCASPSSIYGPLDHPRCFVIDHPDTDGGTDAPMAAIGVDAVWPAVQAALALGRP